MEFKQPPIPYLLRIITKKWTVEILELLFNAELQFSEIERAIPEISGKVLSRRVKELFELGLIGKIISSMTPLEFKYRISDQGKLLQPLFGQLAVVSTRLFRDQILEDPNTDTTEIESFFQQYYHAKRDSTEELDHDVDKDVE